MTDPRGWIDQQYLPDEQRDKRYYEPSEHGAEADVARANGGTQMTAGDLAVGVGRGAVQLGFAALIVVLVPRARHDCDRCATRSPPCARRPRPLLAELRASTADAKSAMAEARDDLDRFDRVLGSAEAISGAVAGGSRVARAALSAPVIKTAALATGTSRAVRPPAAQGTEIRMIKRLTWFVSGAVAGVAGAGIAKRKVKQAATHLTPKNVAHGVSVARRATPSPRVAWRCAPRRPSCAPASTGAS